MMRFFRKHFIPHEGNSHQPYLLRTHSIRAVLGLAFILELGILTLPLVPSFELTANKFITSVLPAVLNDLSNKNREIDHFPSLRVNPLLNTVAEMKAKDMAAKGYFAHTSPEGKNPWYWFTLVGYHYEYAGENLAVDFSDSKDVARAWMNSPTHKANILKNAYTEIGTGIATGTYNGRRTIFVAQVYGRPVGQGRVDIASSSNFIDSTSTNVLGTSTDSETPGFAAFLSPQAPTLSFIAGTTAFVAYVTSPRHIVNGVFLILGVLLSCALLCKAFIRMDKRHPIMITNGLAALVLLFGFYTVNTYMAHLSTSLHTSFASFHDDTFDSIE